MNHTIVPRTGFKPIQMIVGTGQMSECFLEKKKTLTPVHHSIKNAKIGVTELSKSIFSMSETAKENLIQLRQESNDTVNKNKFKNIFKPNDIVFVLDRYNLPGNTRPLKTKFYASPCVVLHSFYTTTLIQRITDGFRALYSNDDIKKYSGADKMFSTLPPEVNKVLLHEFTDMLDSDFKIILENDPLQIPEGIQLFDTVEENVNGVDNSNIFLPSSLLQGKGLSPMTEMKVGPPDNFVDTPDNLLVDDSALPPNLDTDTDDILENSVSQNVKNKENVEIIENENISSEEEE